MSYGYCEGDLLAQPQKYQYTVFQGNGFVKAWQQSRGDMLSQLPPSSLPTLRSIASSDIDSEGVSLTELSIDQKDTVSILQVVCLELRLGSPSHIAKYWLQVLLKKFEVSKRLHRQYAQTAPHRALEVDDIWDLNLYLLLAEALILAWQQEKSTYYLSALLKLVDTLCSQIGRMSLSQSEYLAWILQRESALIVELSEVLGL